jgi:hypothetical protein
MKRQIDSVIATSVGVPGDSPNVRNLSELYDFRPVEDHADKLLEVLRALEKESVCDDRLYRTHLKQVAGRCMKQRSFARAEYLYVALLQAYLHSTDTEITEVVSVLNSLGGLCLIQRRSAEAEAYFIRALQLCQSTFARDSLTVSRPLESLCSLYYMERRYSEAALACRRLLAVSERAFGSSHSRVERIRETYALLLQRLLD